MAWREPARSRAIVAAWLAAAFALSAVEDPRALAAAGAAAALVLRRGLLRGLRRAALAVAPATLAVAAGSWAWLWATAGAPPPLAPFGALALRALVIAFVTFQALDRADLFRALHGAPAASRLLALTLAQAHALRLLATESLLGLRSRLVGRPRARDVVRGAGGITASLFTLAARNARDVSDAMRSRGF